MPFVYSLLLSIVLALPGFARCIGTDLIEALPPGLRAELQTRAETHAFAEGNFWQARRGGQNITIIGTYHLADPRHETALHLARSALETARFLMVEAGPEEMERIKGEAGARPEFMFILEGPTLPELLPPEDWAALSQAAQARGVPGFMAAKMRPWYLATLLSLPACAIESMQKAGAMGLDQQIIQLAQERAVEIGALEPFDTMFSIFEALTPKQELDMLRGYLAMETRPEDLMVTLANAYFRGEVRLIWEFTLHEALNTPGFDSSELREMFEMMEELLMARRNIDWIPLLEQAAAEHGHVLAAFGALHLPGQDGVLNLLRARGWQITATAPH